MRAGFTVIYRPRIAEVFINLYARLAANGTPICDATPMLSSGGKGREIAAWLADRELMQDVAVMMTLDVALG